jgi:NADH:ubiquinone oxidoreductase subunit 4 (subunit M)
MLMMVPLIIAIIWLGVYPQPVINVAGRAIPSVAIQSTK